MACAIFPNTGLVPGVTTKIVDGVTYKYTGDSLTGSPVWEILRGENTSSNSNFKDVYDMQDNGAASVSDGVIVNTGLTSWRITTEVTPINITGTSLYAESLSEIYIDDFIDASNPDDRYAIQRAIDYIEENGRRAVLKIGKPFAMINTTYDGVLPALMNGKLQGIVVKRPDLVWVDFGSSKIRNNVPLLNDLIAVGSDTPVGSSADYLWTNINLDGGSFLDITQEPEYLIRADYNVSRYCVFSNIKGRRSRESNLKFCGFVADFNNCDMRFAQQRANFEVVGVPLDGSGGGARTSIKFDHCVSDYARLYGYSVSGASGTTYCSWINSTSDHIGRDRDGNTIPDVLPFAASFYASGLFSADFLNCGSEFSTRAFRLTGAKAVGLTRCYTNANGSTDGSIVNEQIIVNGFSEQASIKGFRYSNLTNTTYDLSVENPTNFNTNNIYVDNSILTSRIEFKGGNKSSASSLINRLDDFYKDGMRCPGGGDTVVGKALSGNVVDDFGYQFTNMHEFDFSITTAGGGAPKIYEVLTLDDPNAQGALYVILDVNIGRSSAQIPSEPQRLQGKLAVNAGNFSPTNGIETAFTTLDGSANSFSGTVFYWNGSSLRIKTTDQFLKGNVKVKILGRLETKEMTYTPLGVTF